MMERQQIEDIAELQVRRYFDHFLTETLPSILKAERHHMHLTVEAHDAHDDSHGGVEQKFNRVVWMAMGFAAAGGGIGGGLVTLATHLLG